MATKTKKPASFEKTLKLYFSSVSARNNKFAYFNLKNVPNTIVLTNGSYEILSSYIPVTLSIHLLIFKNDFYKQIIEYFQIPENMPFVLRTELVMKALNNHTSEELNRVYDENTNLRLTYNNIAEILDKDDNSDGIYDGLEDDEENDDNTDTNQKHKTFDEDNMFNIGESNFIIETFESADICGQQVTNRYALKLLEEEALKIYERNDTYLTENNIPYLTTQITKDVNWFNSNLFRPMQIPLEDFKQHNTSVFSQEMLPCFLLIIDGMDLVSAKEYLKKQDKECVIYVWLDHKTIKSMAVYEDDEVIIKSMRPFQEIIPLYKTYNKRTTT